MSDSGEELRAALEQLAGVRRAVVEGPPWHVYLLCDTVEATAVPVDMAARAALSRLGISAPDVTLELCYFPAPQPRRRVRFSGVQLQRPRTGFVSVTVRLEWEDAMFEASMEGEGAVTMELRLTAQATLRVLERVLQNEVAFRLVGVKSFTVFDRDLVVVLLRTSDPQDLSLTGVALVTGDLHRATALAVLNATNRLFGNYLAVGD